MVVMIGMLTMMNGDGGDDRNVDNDEW